MTMINTAGVLNQKGISLIEVLVTFIILAVGLLGLLGLHSRLQQSEMEAYQRSQALLLLNDMATRMASNNAAVASYVTTGVGTGASCPSGTGTAQLDLSEWCQALKGAAETSTSAGSTGAMVGARGCVEALTSSRYMITIAWQGFTPLTAPPSSVSCGKDLYDGASGSSCTGDMCRRVVTTILRVPTL